MSEFDGVKVSHDHPVLKDGEWVLPFEYNPDGVTEYECPVYNFVMNALPSDKNSHTIIVRNVENTNTLICATLGHGPENLAQHFPETDQKYGTGFWNTYIK